MRRVPFAPLVALALALPATSAVAETRIKLASLVPDGSPWHRELQQMGDDWQRGTDGRVRLVIYPGGVAGDDPDMVRKMRIGQLQAGTLTVTGLTEIDPAFGLLSIPLFYDSYEELYHVRDGLGAELAARLEAKGFVLLHWATAGWVRFFSKQQVRTIADLKRVKIFTWAGDATMLEVYKKNGFHAVPLAATDIMTGLQTGMIDGLPTTPLAALALQWFRQTPHMLDQPIAPLVGATLVSARTWKSISEADRAVLLAAARRSEERLDRSIPDKDSQAIEEMVARGLRVVTAAEDPAEVERWKRTARDFTSEMDSVPREVLDRAIELRNAFRERSRGSP